MPSATWASAKAADSRAASTTSTWSLQSAVLSDATTDLPDNITINVMDNPLASADLPGPAAEPAASSAASSSDGSVSTAASDVSQLCARVPAPELYVRDAAFDFLTWQLEVTDPAAAAAALEGSRLAELSEAVILDDCRPLDVYALPECRQRDEGCPRASRTSLELMSGGVRHDCKRDLAPVPESPHAASDGLPRR